MGIEDYFPEGRRLARSPVTLRAERAVNRTTGDGRPVFYLCAEAADRIRVMDTGRWFDHYQIMKEAGRVAKILETQNGYKVNIVLF